MSVHAKIQQAMRRLIESEWEITHAQKVRDNALAIFDQTKDLHGLGAEARLLLEAAALLHDIGFTVSEVKHHKHSYDLIKEADLPAFSSHERELVANIARYHTKAFPSKDHKPYARLGEKDRRLVDRLSAILRLADGLNRSHSLGLRELRCESEGRRLIVYLRFVGSLDIDLSGGEKKKDLFEEVFGVKVVFAPEKI